MPPPPDPPWPAPGREPARLGIDGPALVVTREDGSRAPVRLRGLNRSGLQHKASLSAAGFGDPPDPAGELRAWRELWNAHAVRLPLALDRLRPDSAYEAEVDRVVDAAAEAGVYLVLELHGLGDDPYPTLPPEDDAVVVWSRLAARHGARPHVLFDLWNEPHPETLLGGAFGGVRRRAAWEMWREFAQRLIDVIRETGAGETLILAGGVDWAYDLSPLHAPGARLDGRGPLAYATHVYPFKGRAHLARLFGTHAEWRRAFGRVAAELPVVITEFGAAPGAPDDPHFPRASVEEARAWLEDLLGYVDELGLSALAWSAGDRPHLVLARDGREPRDLARDKLDPRTPTTPFGEIVSAWLRA
jgi:sugar phosphate isomerase/epimerase